MFHSLAVYGINVHLIIRDLCLGATFCVSVLCIHSLMVCGSNYYTGQTNFTSWKVIAVVYNELTPYMSVMNQCLFIEL